MAGAECIVLTFRAFWESADSILLPVVAESFPSSGNDLVGIGLMPDIKDNLVRRGVLDIMHADDEFHRAEA